MKLPIRTRSLSIHIWIQISYDGICRTLPRASAFDSWREKKLVERPNTTVAEGLSTRTAFELPQRILRELLDDFVLMSDESILAAVAIMLEKTRTQLSDWDLLEVNEAFAAQVVANGRELDWDWSRLNVHGGAIALGHPIGATGGMLIQTALDELERQNKSTALIAMCTGGGMGTATIIERL